jgi:hypothetical protein
LQQEKAGIQQEDPKIPTLMLEALPQKTIYVLSKEIRSILQQDEVYIDLTVDWTSASGRSAEEVANFHCAEVRAQCLQIWMQNAFLESRQAKPILENSFFTNREILQGSSSVELRQNEAKLILQEAESYHWPSFGLKETLEVFLRGKTINNSATDSLKQLRRYLYSFRIVGSTVTISPETVISTEVSLRAIETLEDGRWINSELLNFAFTLHALCTGACCTIFPEPLLADTGSPKRFYADTYFLPGTVLKLLKKENMIQLYDSLVIPAHLNGNHYVIAEVNCTTGLVESFDSLGGSQEQLRHSILEWLKLQAPKIAWHSKPAICPQQPNLSDCCIYALLAGTYAHQASTERPLAGFYSEGDVPKIRNQLVHAVVLLGNRFRNCSKWSP